MAASVAMTGHDDVRSGGGHADTAAPFATGSALDSARWALRWLVAGPHPVGIDGRGLAGLPSRRVALDELSELLLAPGCPRATRDAVWAQLVRRSRAEGGTWTVACVGVALPALISVAARVTDRFAGDPADIDAAVVAGFLAHLGEVDLERAGIMSRLRWAAYRAGLHAVREALDAPTPRARLAGSAPPPPSAGHPDLVLARAVADGAITAGEAALIGSTRLEHLTLREIAVQRGVSYQAIKRARARAEQRLVAYLRAQQAADTPNTPAPDSTSGPARRASADRGNQGRAVSPNPSNSGVRGRRTPMPTSGHEATGAEARR